MRTTCVRVEVEDAAVPRTDGPFDRILVDPPCSGLGTLQSRPDLRWRARPEAIGELAALQARILAAGAPRSPRAERSCTRSARSRAPRARMWSSAFLDEHRDFPDSRRAASSCCPTATEPTGSSSPAFAVRHKREMLTNVEPLDGPLPCVITLTDPMPKLGPECPGCGEPWLRPTAAPGRYRCVYCLQRYELVSVCPNCGEHSTIVRMSSTADRRLQPLSRQHAAGGLGSMTTQAGERSTATLRLLREPRIAPSILSADFARLGEQVQEVLGGRRAGDPRRRDGRPLRATDHVRRDHRRRDRRAGPRRRAGSSTCT